MSSSSGNRSMENEEQLEKIEKLESFSVTGFEITEIQGKTNTTIQTLGNAARVTPKGSRSEPYIRRAAVYMTQNNFVKAIIELREAIKIDPRNSNSYSLLGMAYLKQNLTTMAKVYINKALELNPEDPRALEGKEKLNKMLNETPTSQNSPSASSGKNSSDNQSIYNRPISEVLGNLFAKRAKKTSS